MHGLVPRLAVSLSRKTTHGWITRVWFFFSTGQRHRTTILFFLLGLSPGKSPKVNLRKDKVRCFHLSKTTSQLCRSLASFNMPVVQSQGNKFLKAGIHLLMHSGILRHDLANLLEQPRAAIVVVALCVL